MRPGLSVQRTSGHSGAMAPGPGWSSDTSSGRLCLPRVHTRISRGTAQNRRAQGQASSAAPAQ